MTLKEKVDTQKGFMREELKNWLNSNEAHGLVRAIHYVDEVSSTNTLVKQLATEGKPQGTLAVAEFQSQGKGRRGRTWIAPKGKDIFMSLLLRPEIDPTKASMLTLVMGLSVAQTLNQLLGVKSQIKWPNDIVIEGRKICGILTEMIAGGENVEYVVIGTGINCNAKEFASEGLVDATSLALVCGKDVERMPIIVAVMQQFETNYNEFLKNEDLANLVDDYNQLLINRNSEVRICKADGSFTGVALGINERGELLVKDGNGKIQAIFTGEVSVRGMQGYV